MMTGVSNSGSAYEDLNNGLEESFKTKGIPFSSSLFLKGVMLVAFPIDLLYSNPIPTILFISCLSVNFLTIDEASL